MQSRSESTGRMRSKLSDIDRATILTLAAAGRTASEIHAAIDAKVSLRQVQRLIVQNEDEIRHRRQNRERRDIIESRRRDGIETVEHLDGRESFYPRILHVADYLMPLTAAEQAEEKARREVERRYLEQDALQRAAFAKEDRERPGYKMGEVVLGEDSPGGGIGFAVRSPILSDKRRQPYSNQDMLDSIFGA